MDHSMVLGYNYSNHKRRQRRTNKAQSWAIVIAMDTAIGRLLAPYHPGGRQGHSNSKQNNNVKCVHFGGRFDGRGGTLVLYRMHCPMEEVRGFHKSH